MQIDHHLLGEQGKLGEKKNARNVPFVLKTNHILTQE
jgi:hypothetical protein